MQLSSEDAARSLAAIDASRAAMRSALRANRGHYQLWLWGLIWIAMALLAEFRGEAGVRLFPWLVLAGFPISILIGATQARRIRSSPVDKRFLGVLAAVILFGLVVPFVLLRGPVSSQALFAYCGLVTMLCYVIAGIWFDTHLLWLGTAMAALILIGLFVFPAIFWWWIAIFGGGPLIATGFYVRYCVP